MKLARKPHSSCLMVYLLVLLLSLSARMVSATEAQECEASPTQNDSCLLSENKGDGDAGMDPMPARMQVITGQLLVPTICGAWCQGAASGPATPCTIDTDRVPCDGPFGCTTTCGLWSHLIVGDKRPLVTCPQFMHFLAYSDKAELCDPSCLLPEIRKERYPLPTGRGLQCVPGTCHPFVQSQNPHTPAELECPCNWFGADCPNDWVAVEKVQATHFYSNGIVGITLTMVGDLRAQLFDQHQPGGVIRVVHRNHTTGAVQEQPYAVAYYHVLEDDESATPRTQIELLTAPTDTSLDTHPRAVAERVRRLASPAAEEADTVTTTAPLENLFINPSIGGFFNKPHYTYLLDFLQSFPETNRLIVVSTGAGLSGALSALEMVPTVHKHLYYGLRSAAADLPYRERLDEWTTHRGLDLHLVESRPLVTNVPKLYAQHAMRRDIASAATSFGLGDGNQQQLLDTSVFVVCGRMELLTETWDELQRAFCSDEKDTQSCKDTLSTRYFTNI